MDVCSETIDVAPFLIGKGPEKERYEELIKAKRSSWKKIYIETVWLKAEDYPKLLASADLGVCLHYSSSGVDLPMKVVDMLGSALPVFAIRYKWSAASRQLFNQANITFMSLRSIHELVEEGKNGFLFSDSTTLNSLFLVDYSRLPI